MPEKNGCGAKHLRLLAIIVVIVLGIVGAAFTYASTNLNGQDARLRQVEQDGSAIQMQLKGIERKLDRIEMKLDKGREANP